MKEELSGVQAAAEETMLSDILLHPEVTSSAVVREVFASCLAKVGLSDYIIHSASSEIHRSEDFISIGLVSLTHSS